MFSFSFFLRLIEQFWLLAVLISGIFSAAATTAMVEVAEAVRPAQP